MKITLKSKKENKNMPWNPDVYNQFKNLRNQPFYDLLAFISSENLGNGIDLGCGTGEQTSILAKTFENAHFLGIDSSAEMLEQSNEFKNDRSNFKKLSVEEFIQSKEKWDLIFSNAALQWSDHHKELFPKILSLLNNDGQFAVQMPVQSENILNQILFQLASEEPFTTQLQNWNRVSPVLGLDDYAKMMYDAGLTDFNISMKVYPIIAEDAEQLFNFISGSALIPYLERLNEGQKAVFIKEYKTRIENQFTKFPAIYSFKRILMYGKKKYL